MSELIGKEVFVNGKSGKIEDVEYIEMDALYYVLFDDGSTGIYDYIMDLDQ
jgi:hypothetical protein